MNRICANQGCTEYDVVKAVSERMSDDDQIECGECHQVTGLTDREQDNA